VVYSLVADIIAEISSYGQALHDPPSIKNRALAGAAIYSISGSILVVHAAHASPFGLRVLYGMTLTCALYARGASRPPEALCARAAVAARPVCRMGGLGGSIKKKAALLAERGRSGHISA